MDIAKTFGRYTLHERIAVGGMAEVYRATARLEAGDEPIVIKTILPQYAHDPYFRSQFHKEAVVVAQLHHPNVIRLFDYGEHEGVLFLAVEAVEGADLAKLLRSSRAVSRPLPEQLALLIARQVTTALAYLHGRTSPSGLPLNMVHRDVSPQNILVSVQGAVKLADFGIAKSAAHESRTATGDVKGKAAYMAPEQASGSTELDARADLYALGAVIFDLFHAERPPSAAERDAALQRAISSVGDPTRAPVGASCADRLLPLIARCLRRDREARHASAEELLAELDRIGGPLPPDAAEQLGAWVSTTLREAAARAPGAGLVHGLLGLPTGGGATARLGDGAARRKPTSAARARSGSWIVPLALGGALAVFVWFGLRPTRPAPPTADSPTSVASAPRAMPDTGMKPSAPRALPREQHTAAAKRPRVEAARPRQRRVGYLTINSIPWTWVYVGGRKRGATPLRRLALPVGQHLIILRDRRARVLRRFTAQISAGRVSLFSFDGLDQARR